VCTDVVAACGSECDDLAALSQDLAELYVMRARGYEKKADLAKALGDLEEAAKLNSGAFQNHAWDVADAAVW